MPTYNNSTYRKIIRPLPSFVERDIYGIPFIEPQIIDFNGLNNTQWLINMKNANPNDKHASEKIVHSFSYDETLIKAYNNPMKYLHKVSKYYAVSSFDFSMHEEMDESLIIYATYSNRWSGAFMQTHGITAIPTVGWVKPNTYNICFAGLKDGGIIIISTLGVNNTTCSATFLAGYNYLRESFPATKLICVGGKVSGMDSDICFIPYKDSFGNWEKYPGFWQSQLFNWDGSVAGGDN